MSLGWARDGQRDTHVRKMHERSAGKRRERERDRYHEESVGIEDAREKGFNRETDEDGARRIRCLFGRRTLNTWSRCTYTRDPYTGSRGTQEIKKKKKKAARPSEERRPARKVGRDAPTRGGGKE